ncbi:MAG: hypothetical protein ACI91F_001843 [Candidatus Binatia bacterium]|jgi:hypothetical protein
MHDRRTFVQDGSKGTVTFERLIRQVSAAPDPKLVESVAQAYCWFTELRELAKREGLNRSDIGRTIRLAFLAPDIVESIVADRQPTDLTTTRLKRIGHLPLSWSEQREILGFTE